MKKKKISDHPNEVIEIYHGMSQPLMDTDNPQITIEEMRTVLTAAGFADTDTKGVTYTGAALRLQVNRQMGKFYDSGKMKGKWNDKASFNDWKNRRFASITNPQMLPGFGDMFDKFNKT